MSPNNSQQDGYVAVQDDGTYFDGPAQGQPVYSYSYYASTADPSQYSQFPGHASAGQIPHPSGVVYGGPYAGAPAFAQEGEPAQYTEDPDQYAAQDPDATQANESNNSDLASMHPQTGSDIDANDGDVDNNNNDNGGGPSQDAAARSRRTERFADKQQKNLERLEKPSGDRRRHRKDKARKASEDVDAALSSRGSGTKHDKRDRHRSGTK